VSVLKMNRPLAVSREETRLAPTGKTKGAYFFVLIFTLLLYGRPQDYWPALNNLHLALIAGTFAGLSFLVSLCFRKAPLVWTTELKLVLALTLWYAIGIPFAHWRSHAIEAFTQDWLKTVFIFFLLTQTLLSLNRIRQIVWAIIGCEFITAVLSVALRGSTLVKNADAERLSGVSLGFLSGNYLGIAAGMTLPFIVIFLLHKKSFLKSIFLLLTFALVTWMLLLTASRSGIIVLVVASFLTWAFILKGKPGGRVLGFVLVVCLATGIFLAPKVFWDRLGTLWGSARGEVATSAEESSGLRSLALRNSVIFSLQHPIFGLGMGNFGIVNGEVTGNPNAWIGTHNIFTQVSSEGGFPTLFVFVAMLYTTLREMRRIGKRTTEDPYEAELVQLARATMVGAGAFVIGGLFAHIALDYYLYFMIGISACLRVLARQRESASAVPSEVTPTKYAPAAASLAVR
jgi:O-antigen ligase